MGVSNKSHTVLQYTATCNIPKRMDGKHINHWGTSINHENFFGTYWPPRVSFQMSSDDGQNVRIYFSHRISGLLVNLPHSSLSTWFMISRLDRKLYTTQITHSTRKRLRHVTSLFMPMHITIHRTTYILYLNYINFINLDVMCVAK